MSAEYVSPKPDGYLNIRNEVYRDRGVKLEANLRKEMAAAKVPAPMNHENSGYKKAR